MKVPSPFPRRMVSVLLPAFAIARSGMPSPLKSPAAIEFGSSPVAGDWGLSHPRVGATRSQWRSGQDEIAVGGVEERDGPGGSHGADAGNSGGERVVTAHPTRSNGGGGRMGRCGHREVRRGRRAGCMAVRGEEDGFVAMRAHAGDELQGSGSSIGQLRTAHPMGRIAESRRSVAEVDLPDGQRRSSRRSPRR